MPFIFNIISIFFIFFLHRLDPTGRGQGVCELIDVPLSEMEWYSSTHNRDENLLYHPEYDYYERDRNTCRPSPCKDCISKPYGPPLPPPSASDHFRPTTYRPNIDHHYKPSYADQLPPNRYRPTGPDSSIDIYRPHSYDSRPSIYDGGRPPSSYDSRPPYDSKPPDYDRYDISGPSSGGGFRPPTSYGGDLDRYDHFKPIEISRPGYQEVILTTADHGYDPHKDSLPNPFNKDHYNRPDFIPIEDYRPHFRPSTSGDSSYLGPYRPNDHDSSYRPSGGGSRPSSCKDCGSRPPPSLSTDHRYPPAYGSSVYLDRDPPLSNYRKPATNFIPYSIGEDKSYGSYGGSYGGSSYSKYSSNYWGLQNDIKRKDGPNFNYFELGGSKQYGDNSIWNYPGSRYDSHDDRNPYQDKMEYGSIGHSWTRRPGQDGIK